MRICLQVVAPGGAAYPFDHEGGRLTVGRDPDCDLVFNGDLGQAVSWRHLQIELTPQDARLQDLGSTNGTYLNGERVQGVTLLREGDRVQLGRTGPKLRVAELDLSPSRSPQYAAAPIDVEPAEPTPLRAVPASFGPPAAPAAPPPVPQAAPEAGGTHVRMRSMRKTLGELASNQRKMILGLGILALLGIAALGVVVWLQMQEIDEHKGTIKALQARLDTKAAPRDQEVQARVLRSLAWLHWDDGKTSTGSVIDRKGKLLLTVSSSGRPGEAVSAVFPQFTGPAEVVRERDHYNDAARVNGKVAHRDPDSHLTLVRLESLPEEADALPLAERSAPPSSRVYAVGNPPGSPKLWEWAEGHLWKNAPMLGPQAGAGDLEAWCVELMDALHGGDQGGPVVNEQGELVAVHSGQGSPARRGTLCIDVRTIQAVRAEHDRDRAPRTVVQEPGR